MATNEEGWVGDIINDFIHSPIWSSPIQTFIDANCACFDFNNSDDHQEVSSPLLDEQKHIYKQYQKLVNSLVFSLGEDLRLDENELKNFSHQTDALATDDSSEQFYAAYDLYLFTEMMKRKNLILQLQVLVNLQLECGLLKQTDTNDDQVLQLLLQATSSSKRSLPRDSSNSTHQDEINAHRHQQPQIKSNDEPKTIDSLPEEVLREKLHELTISTTPVVDRESAASTRSSRENFLKQQRDLIVKKQRDERVRELEKEVIHARPQSAVKVARKAMETADREESQVSSNELEKRRAMAAKLRREVVDKR